MNYLPYFRSNEDMLLAFYTYLDDRPALALWRTKNYDMVVKPPSIIDFAKWLENCFDEEWSQINLKSLKRHMASDLFQDAAQEIHAVIEDNVVANALVGNYSTAFAQKYLQQKYGWERMEMDDSKVIIIGLDGVKELLPEIPKVGLPKKEPVLTIS